LLYTNVETISLISFVRRKELMHNLRKGDNREPNQN
jgi:hypothetical protein